MACVRNTRKIYVANISRHAREKDIGRLFEEPGRIASLEHKGNFGFIEYETNQAAEEAIRRLHDHDFMGKRLIVKPYRYRGGDFRYNPDAAPNPAKFRGPRSVSYRLYITGLDDSTSWQDVKDFARTGGRSVCYTDVYQKHGKKEGVIEYYRREDFEYALRYLDRARLNGCRVRVFDRQPADDDNHNDNNNNNNNNGRRHYGGDNHNGNRSRSRSRDRGRNNGNYGGRGGGGYDNDYARNRGRDNRDNRDNGRDRIRSRSGDRDNNGSRRDYARNNDHGHYNDNNNNNNNNNDNYRRNDNNNNNDNDNNYNRHHQHKDNNNEVKQRRSRSNSQQPPPRNDDSKRSPPPPHPQSNNNNIQNDNNSSSNNNNDQNINNDEKGIETKRDSRSKSPPNYQNNGRRQRSVSRSKSNY